MSDDSNWKPSHKIGRAGPKQNVIGSAVPIKQPHHEVWPDRILRAHARRLGLDADSVADSIRVQVSNADPNKGRARWDAAFMEACRTAPGTNGSDPSNPCGDSVEENGVVESAHVQKTKTSETEHPASETNASGMAHPDEPPTNEPKPRHPTQGEPPRNVAVLPSSTTLRYDEMCSAITAAYQVDEVKQLMDQAMAIEVYARQSQNMEAERQACEIRLRATRRLGQLLGQREKAKAGRPSINPSPAGTDYRGAKPLVDLGIPRNLSSKAQRLAALPEPVFEHEIKQPGRSSAAGIIAAAAPPNINAADDDALWLWAG